MKTQAHQLPQLLQKGLSPVYLVSGDEPLLVQECCDQIRKTAVSYTHLTLPTICSV